MRSWLELSVLSTDMLGRPSGACTETMQHATPSCLVSSQTTIPTSMKLFAVRRRSAAALGFIASRATTTTRDTWPFSQPVANSASTRTGEVISAGARSRCLPCA